jgi:hypothetical protein
VFWIATVGEKNRSGGNDLQIDAIAIHFFQTHVHVPASRRDMPEDAVADHDVGFARLGVFDPRPIGRAKPRGQVRPGLREKVSMNVYHPHIVSPVAIS